jgi:hypothetical protein
MDRRDVRYSDDYGAPHPGRLDQDMKLRELRADAPKASAAEILTRVRSELRRRGQAAPAGLAKLVDFLMR